MKPYVSRLWRRLSEKRRGSDRETLEQIAAIVWGSEGSPKFRPPFTKGYSPTDLLDEIRRRIPPAIGNRAQAVEALRLTLENSGAVRFRFYVRGIEIGAYVQGRNVRFTLLGQLDHAQARECGLPAIGGVVADILPGRRVESDEEGIDEQMRPYRWVRFAE